MHLVLIAEETKIVTLVDSLLLLAHVTTVEPGVLVPLLLLSTNAA